MTDLVDPPPTRTVDRPRPTGGAGRGSTSSTTACSSAVSISSPWGARTPRRCSSTTSRDHPRPPERCWRRLPGPARRRRSASPSRRTASRRCSRRSAPVGSVGIDACSPGEVLHALANGWRADEISVTATNLSERDLDVILAHDVHLNLDAVSQLERVGRRAPGGRSASAWTRAPARAITRASSTAVTGRRSSA